MLYVPNNGKASGISKSDAKLLIETMQQGMLYAIFSALVVKRLHGKEAMGKYMDKMYKKLSSTFPEYFIMLRKIDSTEWESIYNNWMGLDHETKKA